MPSYNEVHLEAKEKMAKTIEMFTEELRRIRSGRATPALVENIRADYYGTQTPLKQMANISVPEPRLLVIKPYDASVLKAIEKALLKSELGITPLNDGKLIRLAVPSLSEERRKALVNQVKEMGEKAKISLRNVRRDAHRQSDQMQKDGEAGEDDIDRLKNEIHELTKKSEENINEIFENKKKEILEI